MSDGINQNGTPISGGLAGGNKNSEGGSRNRNACDLQLREGWQYSDWTGSQQGAHKRRTINSLGPKVYYPDEMNVESVEIAKENVQHAWSEMDRLTEGLTENVTDISFDFREMLYGNKEVLNAAQP